MYFIKLSSTLVVIILLFRERAVDAERPPNAKGAERPKEAADESSLPVHGFSGDLVQKRSPGGGPRDFRVQPRHARAFTAEAAGVRAPRGTRAMRAAGAGSASSFSETLPGAAPGELTGFRGCTAPSGASQDPGARRRLGSERSHLGSAQFSKTTQSEGGFQPGIFCLSGGGSFRDAQGKCLRSPSTHTAGNWVH